MLCSALPAPLHEPTSSLHYTIAMSDSMSVSAQKDCTYLAQHELESVLIPIVDDIFTERVAHLSHGCQLLE